MTAPKHKKTSSENVATPPSPTPLASNELAERAKTFDNMEPVERAAAVMHMVYFSTTARTDVDWTPSLPENWVDLDDKARNFNLKMLETWAENPELLEVWVQAVKALAASRKRRRSSGTK